MSKSAPTGDKGTDNDRLGNHGVPRLGIDAEGARHYYDEEHERVLVTQNGNVEHVEDDIMWADTRAWKKHVQKRRGIAVWGGEQFQAGLREIGEAVNADDGDL